MTTNKFEFPARSWLAPNYPMPGSPPPTIRDLTPSVLMSAAAPHSGIPGPNKRDTQGYSAGKAAADH